MHGHVAARRMDHGLLAGLRDCPDFIVRREAGDVKPTCGAALSVGSKHWRIPDRGDHRVARRVANDIGPGVHRFKYPGLASRRRTQAIGRATMNPTVLEVKIAAACASYLAPRNQ